MREFTSQELQKKISEVQEAALVEPVAITFRGRRRHIMMSVKEFERLQRLSEPKVYQLGELPDDLLSDLARAEMGAEHEHLNLDMEAPGPGVRGKE